MTIGKKNDVQKNALIVDIQGRVGQVVSPGSQQSILSGNVGP